MLAMPITGTTGIEKFADIVTPHLTHGEEHTTKVFDCHQKETVYLCNISTNL